MLGFQFLEFSSQNIETDLYVVFTTGYSLKMTQKQAFNSYNRNSAAHECSPDSFQLLHKPEKNDALRNPFVQINATFKAVASFFKPKQLY